MDQQPKKYTLGGREYTIAQVTARRMSRLALLFGARTMSEVADLYLGKSFDESRDSIDRQSAIILDSDEKLKACLEIFFVEPVGNASLEDVGALQFVEIMRDFWTGSAPSAVVELVSSTD